MLAKSLQLCLTLFDPMDPPGSSVHGILQARRLECVAISFSRGSYWLRDRTHVSYTSCIGRWVLYHLIHQGSLYIWGCWYFSWQSWFPFILLKISLWEVLLPQSWLRLSHKQCRIPRTGITNSNTFEVSRVTDAARLKMLNYSIMSECRENACLRRLPQKEVIY